MRKTVLFALIALSAVACQKGTDKKGPFVAEGKGVAVTAEEFKARLDEQSPFIRSRYTTLERKKEFLDNLLRFEILAAEAQRRGMEKDPDVQLTLKKVMVQKLVQKSFGDPQEAAKAVPDSETQAYYDQHKDEYVKPLRLRLYQLLVKAPASGPDRAKKQAAARKLLDRIRAEEKKNQLAFVSIARENSEDEASKATGGDLGFKSREEFEKSHGKGPTEAVFGLKDNETSGLLESPQGFVIVKIAGRQEALDRPFDQVKAQIAQKIAREKKTKEFDDFVKKLREDAQVKVYDGEVEKVAVAASPAAPGGGMPPGPMALPNAPVRPGGPEAMPPAPPRPPAPAPAR